MLPGSSEPANENHRIQGESDSTLLVLRKSATITPMTDTTRVYVYESRPWIVAHTAAAKCQSRVAQGESIDAGDADIDSVCLHVKTALGDA